MKLKKEINLPINADDEKLFDIFSYQIIIDQTYSSGERSYSVYRRENINDAFKWYEDMVKSKSDLLSVLQVGRVVITLCNNDRIVKQILISTQF